MQQLQEADFQMNIQPVDAATELVAECDDVDK
jgi:hypothetical protein